MQLLGTPVYGLYLCVSESHEEDITDFINHRETGILQHLLITDSYSIPSEVRKHCL